MGRPVGQRNMQPAAAAGEQTAASSSEQQQAVVVLRGVALLYESPGGNQVDGLPPVPTLKVPQSHKGVPDSKIFGRVLRTMIRLGT